MSIQALREQRNELSRQANHLLAEKGAQVWAQADQEKFDGLADQMDRIDKQISAHQRMLDKQAEELVPTKKDTEHAKTQAHAGVEVFLRTMTNERTPEQRELIRNTMSTTTGSQGGYTVPSQVSSDLVDTMKDYGAMRRRADRLATSSGNDLNYPTSDGTAEIGEIVTQNSSSSSADPSFGTVPLNVVKFGSKVIAVPIELLQDSAVDVLALINKRVRDRIGRIQNQKFSTGSGTGEPNGLVTAASVGKTGTTGQTTTIIYDDLVDIIDSVDVAYLTEGDMYFMFGQTLRRTIRKIKDTAGRPIWTPSYDAGASAGLPDLLLGYPVEINNDMPTPAANAYSLAFGQIKKYMVRDAMDITLFRFEDSAYITKGQIGFMAWCRAGGNLIDTAAVKTYRHSAT